MTEILPPEMKKQFQEAMELIKNSTDIKIYSHTDCDGISSGAILTSILQRLGKKVEIKIVNLDALEDVEINHELTIFSDLGSGQPVDKNAAKDSKILILDHHPPLRDIDYCNTVEYYYLEINPIFYGIDGSQEICGGGLCYLLAKEFGYKDLSWIGILAAIGDIQNGKTGRLEGLNRLILKDAEEEGLVNVIKEDISLYGRQTRALYESLSYFSDVKLPFKNTNEILDWLKDKKINTQNPITKTSIKPCDLNIEEKELLIRELGKLIVMRIPKRYWQHAEKLIKGESYEFIKEMKYKFLRDASEFSTAMNACVRNNKPEVALNLLLLTINRYEIIDEILIENKFELLMEIENDIQKTFEKMNDEDIAVFEKVQNKIIELLNQIYEEKRKINDKIENKKFRALNITKDGNITESGNEKTRLEVLNELEDIRKEHKSYLAENIEKISEQDIIQKDNLQYFNGKDIRSNVVGTIAGMVLNKGDWRKPIIAFAPLNEGSEILKLSLRCSKLLAYDGVHFGSIIRKVSQSLGGNGGGHDVACGAYIRKDQKEEFFDMMNKELEGKLVLD